MPIITEFELDNPYLDPYREMSDRQLRRGNEIAQDSAQGFCIAESARVAERALQAGVVPYSILVTTSYYRNNPALLDEYLERYPEVPIFISSNNEFSKITGYKIVRGIIACLFRPREKSVEDVINNASRLVIVENVMNFENMGSIFRSAAGLGWDGILVSPSCHDPLYRRCSRVSMGTAFHIPWARIEDVPHWEQKLFEKLKQKGFVNYALALKDDSSKLGDFKSELPHKLSVVFGTENTGLRPQTIQSCDQTLTIPMFHGTDSLNVAACASIVLWELRKR